MNILQHLIDEINKKSDPLENHYFIHAFSALEALNRVDKNNFCYDDVSRAVYTLERLYKGFLYAAQENLGWYRVPDTQFLTQQHDLSVLFKEIMNCSPYVFPRQNRYEWEETQQFLKDLSNACFESRYTTYPTYEEFDSIRKFVNYQKKIIETFIKSGGLEETDE
ncbi:MAG: hypothetical protein K6D02_05230 [Lachnospiraceae bacterium]|nr:hypothetical protein [Lachnospiraceae bacterium]